MRNTLWSGVKCSQAMYLFLCLKIICSSATVTIDGSSGIVSASAIGNNQAVTAADIAKVEGQQALDFLAVTDKTPTNAFVTAEAPTLVMQSSSNTPTSGTKASSSGAYFSASDPVLVSSQDSRLLGVGTIKREKTPEQISVVPVESKSIAGRFYSKQLVVLCDAMKLDS